MRDLRRNVRNKKVSAKTRSPGPQGKKSHPDDDGALASTGLVAPHGLTLKQEMFARAFIECDGNATAAYEAAYDVEGMLKTSVHRKAHEVLHNVKVSARIDELLAPALEEHQINVHSLVSMYVEAYQLARRKGAHAGMVNATNGIAKVTGHDKIVIEDGSGPIEIVYIRPDGEKDITPEPPLEDPQQ